MSQAKKIISTACKNHDASKEKTKTHHDQEKLKIELEILKKTLTQKLKDPALAKKAALIISEMINKKN